jgi:hypothetical protein
MPSLGRTQLSQAQTTPLRLPSSRLTTILF